MVILGRCAGSHGYSRLNGCPVFALGRVVGLPALRSSPVRRHVREQLDCVCRALSVTTASTTALQSLGAGTVPRQVPHHPALPVQLPPPLAYEIVEGALVRGCSMQNPYSNPPTVVLVHGILGSRRNMQKYAKMLVEGFPSWQALLVDLRCHGESVSSAPLASPHSVESAAKDILLLLSSLKLFPHVLIGHSFGGKVVMSMAEQFGKRLPRPVQVWVLDALPGEVRSGERNRRDHPSDLISTLKTLELPITARSALIDRLLQAGFSQQVSSWMTTNLRPTNNRTKPQELLWSFDLDGVEEMYRSYEHTNLWPLLVDMPQGLRLHFVRAEGSHYRWAGRDQELIESYGHAVHLLKDSGHWAHADNPSGLFNIMKDSIGHVDLRMRC